jgi:hypothetical protein
MIRNTDCHAKHMYIVFSSEGLHLPLDSDLTSIQSLALVLVDSGAPLLARMEIWILLMDEQ